MSIWVIKCREVRKDRLEEGWHWDSYFNWRYPNELFKFGGDDWIKSPWSKKYIREEVKKGDLVVCYQFEGKKICGLTRMASDGQKADGSGDYNWFFLSPVKESLLLKPPLSIPELRDTGCNPKYFREGQGTIFPVEPYEFNDILTAIVQLNPGMRPSLVRWLQSVGYNAEI